VDEAIVASLGVGEGVSETILDAELIEDV